MTKYVLGFMFDQKSYGVLLIQKIKPAWQAGKLNGIGGKIEPNENSLQAMQREFKEETGIDQFYWEWVTQISGDDWSVEVFTCKDDKIHDFASMEDEHVLYIPLDELHSYDVISNLDWLIPMCLDAKNINYKVSNHI